MSKPARSFRFSPPRWLVLVAVLQLAGLAIATAYLPADAVASSTPTAPVAHQAARTAGQPALRVGVAALPRGERPGDVRLYTEEGFEYELGTRLAARLGRDVRFVKIDLAQRGRALDEGAIDVFVGRFAARPVPAGVDVFVSGYRSGLSVAMRTDTTVRSWKDLAGRTVCVSDANLQARETAISHGALVKVTDVPALSLMHVRTGDCDAAIHDATLLRALFDDKKWEKFSATLPATDALPLAVAVAHADPAMSATVREVLASARDASDWRAPARKWASNVAFEVELEQDSPDCH